MASFPNCSNPSMRTQMSMSFKRTGFLSKNFMTNGPDIIAFVTPRVSSKASGSWNQCRSAGAGSQVSCTYKRTL